MNPASLLILPILLSLCCLQSEAGQVLERTIEEWIRYRDECYRQISSTPLTTGLHCNRTFDLYACWPDGTPGTITNVSCPYYLPWFQKVRHGMVLRRCGLDGIWVLANGTNTWRDSSQCEDDYEETSDEAAVGCRMAQVIMQYCILANHYWFVVEAMYLYNLLTGAGFFEKNVYILYLYFGWGTPVLFVTPWVTLKYLKENSECWALNDNMGYWWIIRVPILLASLINFVIFMKILKMILSKLRDNQKGYPDYKLRLAKATLTLIPLFGIHEVVFIFGTDEQTSGILHYIKVFFSLFLNSFQGFLVAVLYCFANKEVRSEMWKKWQLWRMDSSALCCR